MGMIVMLIMVNDDVVIGDKGFYTYMVYLAFVMMVMRGFNSHSETLNLVAESLAFLLFFEPLLYCFGMFYTSENYMGITYHTCAS